MNTILRIAFCFVLYSGLITNPLFAQDAPPVVTAAGNQVYCPGTSINIVTDFNITDPDDTTTNAIYIQISEGYVNGQDQLSLSAPIPNVNASWNAVSGKLILSGSSGQELPYTTLINAVENVVYTNNSASPSGSRSFSITVGEANYLPSTEHYYRFISNVGITWTAAKTAAENSTYYGLQGYLATLTAQDEAQLCGEQATGTGWIGGSDATTEGVWKWVTGPEAGTTFWNGNFNGSTPNFAFWNTGEPNNAGEEDYAHITAPGVGVPGSWNDLPNAGSGAPYVPMGYIVEYGGMPGDPVLQISASTGITIPKLTGSTDGDRCSTGTVILNATVSDGIAHWYAQPTGGTPLATGSSFTTPVLTETTTYYVSAFGSLCDAPRTPVTAIIIPIPTVNAPAPVTICGPGTAILQIETSAEYINWFDVPTGGTTIGFGDTIASPFISSNTTFYAEPGNNNCTSPNRIAVDVIVTPLPTVTASTPLTVCGGGSVTLEATPSAGTINWYDQPTGGTLIGSGTTIISPAVNSNITFYAEAVNGTCMSAARAAVDVIISVPPTITATSPLYICTEGTTTLEATPTSGIIAWYDQPTGGIIIGTGNSITSPYLTETTIFYAETDDNGCLSAVRVPVEVIVTQLPTVTSAPAAAACEGTTALLEATPSDGIINWYGQPAGGNLLGTGNIFESPIITANTTFYAEAVNNGCTSAERIAVTVTAYAAPIVNHEVIYYCEGSFATLDAGLENLNYSWNTGQETKEIIVVQPGTYSVTLINAGGCSAVKTFIVIERERPVIDGVGVGVGGTIMIIMENYDTSEFEYSIDGINYQPSNTFANLSMGTGIAHVRNINGCGADSEKYTIHLVPAFFTPNNDNYNDLFTIARISAYPEATLTIFDRYGKIITRLNYQNRIWDGTYKGKPLPATDYWYVLKLDKESPEIIGHFSLMR